MRWLVTSVTVVVIALVLFVRPYLGPGRLWLAWFQCGVRALLSVINFLPGRSNIVFREVNPPKWIEGWSVTISMPAGIRTGWAVP